ncbi:MAG: catalytic domain of component of various dehydrogenase complexe, partial [Conexibacter sp.]|nr:catalytic domain of component of various dehydrogenase complexe [Conexibacter sp.]
MPRLSDSMEEGTIITWLKATGDEVQRGEEIVEIETDKANMTYEADASGVLEIIAPEGATLPIGEPIATIGDGTRAAAAAAAPAARGAGPSSEEARVVDAEIAAEEADARSAVPATSAAGNGASDGNGRVRASPVARRLARELGVDLAAVSGSGPGGRIVKADVEASAQGGGASAAPAPVVAVAEPAAAEPVAA